MVAEMVDAESQLVLSSWRMLEHPESLHTDHSDPPFCRLAAGDVCGHRQRSHQSQKARSSNGRVKSTLRHATCLAHLIAADWCHVQGVLFLDSLILLRLAISQQQEHHSSSLQSSPAWRTEASRSHGPSWWLPRLTPFE